MATLVQLQAESWWSREIVTAELDWLGDELCRRTGRPRVAAGTKGDVNHLRGAHRSQEWITRSRWATSRTYTVQSGLTAMQARYVAGFDFTPASNGQMLAMCRRLAAALRAGTLEEIREFYGNVDGDRHVDGWDNLANRAATSDPSHLWHLHLTFDRRQLTNRALMERLVRIIMGDPVSTVEDKVPEPVKLEKDTANAVTEIFTTAVAMRDGATVATGGNHAAGPHWTVETLKRVETAVTGGVRVTLTDEQLTELAEAVADRLSTLRFVASDS